MAFSASALHLLSGGAAGKLRFHYSTSDDSMATVLANGYFLSSSVNVVGLTAGDHIFCQCSDGNMLVRVSAASQTAVVCKFAGGDLPIRTWATGTAAGDGKLKVGFYEVGTSIATGSRAVLPTPYPGAEVIVFKVDSGTQIFHFDAGGSASDFSMDASDGAAGGGTGVTYDSVGNRRIQLQAEGEWFHVKATSTSRWRLYGHGHQATAVNEGASVFLGGT